MDLHDLTIIDGVLDASGDAITFNGTFWDNQTTTTAGAEFTQDGSGSVTFTNSGPITINGANSFYIFNYSIANGTLIFEALNGNAIADVTQTIKSGGNFIINGQAAVSKISLRSTNPGAAASSSIPAVPNANQWVINIESGAFSDISFADIRDSNAYNTSGTGPPPNTPYHAVFPKSSCVDGGDNTLWIFSIPIENSWTEDVDGDGRIDRIRVRVSDLVDLSGGDGTGVTAYVEGHTGAAVTRVNATELYEFFITFDENNQLDTDETPLWRLESNPGAVATGLFGVGGASVVDSPLYYITPLPFTYEDRAAPVVGYTLAMAGKNQIFVHMSEPVQRDTNADGHGDGPIQSGDFSYSGGASITGLTRVTTSGSGTSEFLLNLDSPVTADDIYNQETISLAAGTDLADNYDVFWPGTDSNPLADEDTRLPGGQPIARVSDLGLGALGTDETGIFQPVWATTDTTNRSALGGTGTIDRVEYGDFDSTGWLQDEDFTLQIALDSSFPNAGTETVDLIWDTSVGSPYLLNGLWLPAYDPPDLAAVYGYTPYPLNGAPPTFLRDFVYDLVNVPNTLSVIQGPVSSSGATRTYHFDSTDSKIVSGKEFQFFLRDNSPDPLIYARVGDPNAADWYRTIRPWSFLIRDVIEQTDRITILDNVIDPTKGEKAELQYVLAKSGTITIQVFNLAGDLVDILYRGRKSAGEYSTAWDGRNRAGNIVARGIYFVRFTGPGIDQYRKVMVVK